MQLMADDMYHTTVFLWQYTRYARTRTGGTLEIASGEAHRYNINTSKARHSSKDEYFFLACADACLLQSTLQRYEKRKASSDTYRAM